MLVRASKTTFDDYASNTKHTLMLLLILFVCYLCLELVPVFAARQGIEIPLFEGQLTAQQMRANTQFVASIDRARLSHKEAAKREISEGWRLLSSRQAIMATKRFNQAWLLDPKNANVFWGLGCAETAMGEFPNAIKLLNTAASLDKNNAYIICDIGCTYMFWGAPLLDAKQHKALLEKAIAKYQEAIKLDPKCEKAYSKCALAFRYEGKFIDSWQMVKKARQLGGQTIDPHLVNTLSKIQSEPH